MSYTTVGLTSITSSFIQVINIVGEPSEPFSQKASHPSLTVVDRSMLIGDFGASQEAMALSSAAKLSSSKVEENISMRERSLSGIFLNHFNS